MASEGGKGIPVLDTTIRYGNVEADGPWFKKEDGQRTPGEQMVTGGVKKQVIYELYMKPMTKRLGLFKRSALSENTKVSSASADQRSGEATMWKGGVHTVPGGSRQVYVQRSGVLLHLPPLQG